MTATVTDINDARSPLQFALRYVRAGLWVLPLEPGTKKPLGKLVRNGFHDATNDAETARAWWTTHPTAGIGVAVRKSGWVVVDIDPRNGGIETIDALEAQHGALASDVLAYTGGGGEHRVFAAELVEALPGKLGPGVDLKADGYIAVEPTLHPSGKAYAWEASSDPLDGVIPTTLPGWIRDLGRGVAPAPAYTPPPVRPIDAARLASAREALAAIASDDRDAWVRVGAAIHNEMPTQAGFDLWAAWSQGSPKYDPQDQLRVWRSFKVKGLAGVGLNSVFAMAQAAGWKNTGAPIQQEPQPPADGLPMLTLAELEAASAQVSWSIKHVLPADSVGMMFGAPGTFKSFIALDMALHIAHGMPWMGRKTRQGPVIYIAAEGGSGLWRRVKAWHQARRKKIDAPLYVVPVAVQLRSKAAAVVAAAERVGVRPALVVVDTLSQTFEGEENSATDIAGYLTALGAAFRALWACSVMVIHHSGHGATERPRGSSAILGNTDYLFGVFRDEKQLLATLTCERQKDGELFKDELFELTSHLLGKDADGDEIRSLAARHVNQGAEAAEALARQVTAGRGGRNAVFMGLVHNGMTEKELRKSFYEQVSDLKDMDARKVAFYRARDAATKGGYIEIAGDDRRVIVLKEYP